MARCVGREGSGTQPAHTLLSDAATSLRCFWWRSALASPRAVRRLSELHLSVPHCSGMPSDTQPFQPRCSDPLTPPPPPPLPRSPPQANDKMKVDPDFASHFCGRVLCSFRVLSQKKIQSMLADPNNPIPLKRRAAPIQMGTRRPGERGKSNFAPSKTTYILQALVAPPLLRAISCVRGVLSRLLVRRRCRVCNTASVVVECGVAIEPTAVYVARALVRVRASRSCRCGRVRNTCDCFPLRPSSATQRSARALSALCPSWRAHVMAAHCRPTC